MLVDYKSTGSSPQKYRYSLQEGYNFRIAKYEENYIYY